MTNDAGTYIVGETRDTDSTWLDAQDALWTSAGFGGPSIADFLGLNSPYRVTGKQALEQAAVLICLDVLSQDISKATLRMKEKLADGGERVIDHRQHPVAEMLALEPNQRHTWPEFIAMMVFHLGMTSNSYAYVRRSATEDPLELIPLMPARVQDQVNPESKEIFYDIEAGTEHEAALLGRYYLSAPARDVMHVRQRMLDGFYGYSTLFAGGRTLSLGRTLEDYERKVFNEDGLIRGAFVRPAEAGAMTDDVFRRVQGQLKKLMRRVRDNGDPILLEDGITYKEIAQKASETEMVKALDKLIEMICKLWRMPPHKAMHLNAVKYENLATLENIYVRDTLVPLCRLIEARLAKSLLSRKDRLRFRFEFDRDEMAIADEKVENERVVKLAERGIIEVNEARKDQGYNRAPWGDVRIVPVNTVLVDKDSNVVVSGAKSTGAEEPEIPDESEAPQKPDTEDEAEDQKKGLHLAVSN